MSKITDNKPVLTIDNKSGKVTPTPKKIDLKSINDVRLEMANIYRAMKAGSIETSDGTKLCYVLSAIGKMIESADIEARIALLERNNNGNN